MRNSINVEQLLNGLLSKMGEREERTLNQFFFFLILLNPDLLITTSNKLIAQTPPQSSLQLSPTPSNFQLLTFSAKSWATHKHFSPFDRFRTHIPAEQNTLCISTLYPSHDQVATTIQPAHHCPVSRSRSPDIVMLSSSVRNKMYQNRYDQNWNIMYD